jgi:hypothetical protein
MQKIDRSSVDFRGLANELMAPMGFSYDSLSYAAGAVKSKAMGRWNSMDRSRRSMIKHGAAYAAAGVAGHCLSLYLFGVPGFPPAEENSVKFAGQFGGHFISAGLDYIGVFFAGCGIGLKNERPQARAEPSPQTKLDGYI